MLVQAHHVITLRCRVTTPNDEVVDPGTEPVYYLHGGYDSIFPALEAALDGQSLGSSLRIPLSADQTFGPYDDGLLRVEPVSALPGDVVVGSCFETQLPQRPNADIFTVVEIRDGYAVMDANHPLAGQDLVFHIVIDYIRPATSEECQAGTVLLKP